MATLHPAEVDHYRREGWVVPRFRLDAAQVDRLRDALDELLHRNPGVRPEKLVSAHIERDGRRGDNGEGVRGVAQFLDLGRDPQIVDLVSGVIGQDILLWGCHVFCKPAFEGWVPGSLARVTAAIRFERRREGSARLTCAATSLQSSFSQLRPVADRAPSPQEPTSHSYERLE